MDLGVFELNNYWVVHKFSNDKASVSRDVTSLNKKSLSAEIEQTKDGMFVVSLGYFSTMKEVNAVIHKAIDEGYWAGIYKGE